MTYTINEHMKATGARLGKYKKQDIASSIALFWLKNAERIIAEGNRPAKLSEQVHTLLRDHLDGDRFLDGTYIPAATITKLEKAIVAKALEILMAGRYPTVRKFFTPKKEEN